MRPIFYLAGGLLCVSGALHLVRLLTSSIATNPFWAAVTGLLGVAYLVVGFGLVRQRETAVRWGFILPIIGLLLALPGLGANTDTITIAIVAFDLLVIGLVGYLMLAGRGLLNRVQ